LQGSRAAAHKAMQPNRPQELLSLQQAYNQALSDANHQQALVRQAQSNYQTAYNQAKRYQTLVSQGAVSQADAEVQLNNARTAKAQLEGAAAQLKSSELLAAQALQRLHLAREGGRREDIVIAHATAEETAANVQQLRAQIAQTVIRAPDDGLIIKRDAHLGDISAPTKVLFQMVRKGQLEMRAQVTQKDLARIKVGTKAEITNEHGTTAGQVWTISPALDPATRLGIVRIGLPLGSGFMPGMFAKARLDIGTLNTIAVPDSAVVNEGTAQFVFVYDNGIARKRPVIPGERAGGLVEIKSGLLPGQNVITSGAGFLNDGDPVRLAGASNAEPRQK
jgi:HlyD family secretion protein